MTPFADLSKGLKLPRHNVMVPWGASFEALRDSADYAKDWLPYGHTERYGQLHWHDEPLLPEEKYNKGYTGGVIAYVRGNPPTVRTFSLGIKDDVWLKQEVYQYHAWMTRLIPILGLPSVDTEHLVSAHHIVPPCEWRQGKVRFLLSYSFMKGEPYLDFSLSHADYPLHN